MECQPNERANKATECDQYWTIFPNGWMVVESQTHTHTESKWNGFGVVRIRKIRRKSIFLLLEFTQKMNFRSLSTFVQAHTAKTSVTFFNYWNAVVHFSFMLRNVIHRSGDLCKWPFGAFVTLDIWKRRHLSSSDHPMIKMFQNYRFEMLLICVFITHHVYCFFLLQKIRVCVRVLFFRILIKKFVNAMVSFRYTKYRTKKIKRQSKTIDVISISLFAF